MARPLSAMLCRDADIDFAAPTAQQTAAFEELRRRVATPPILALPKVGQPYRLEIYPSQYQVGCTLLQRQDDDAWMRVGYWSKTLNLAEQNYCATERECLATVWSMRTLLPYLEGTRFTVRTDHDALRLILNLTDSTGRLARWRLLLSEFDFDIDYIPGRRNSVSDAMSRLLALRSPSQSTPIETDVPTFSVEERCNPSCTHLKVLMTAKADDPHPNILDPDLRGQASRHDHAQDQEGPEKDEVDEEEVDFDVFEFDIARQDDSVPDPEDPSYTLSSFLDVLTTEMCNVS